jgi:hypothetical protein
MMSNGCGVVRPAAALCVLEDFTFSLDFSFAGASATTGAASCCEATFRLRSSSGCASAPVVRTAVVML